MSSPITSAQRGELYTFSDGGDNKASEANTKATFLELRLGCQWVLTGGRCCLPITVPLNYTCWDTEKMMSVSTEIVNSWKPVGTRWQEPVPSNSARASCVLCFLCFAQGFCCGCLPPLLPWVQLLHLLKQQPPLPGLQSICPYHPVYVDREGTRESWAAAVSQHRCSGWDLISSCVSQKLWVWLTSDWMAVSTEPLTGICSCPGQFTVPYEGSWSHPRAYSLEFFPV